MWTVAGVLLAACLALGLGSWGGGKHGSHSSSAPARQATRSIEDIRVGERVLARNPDASEIDFVGDTAVDPATWRHLRLRAEERWEDGTLDVLEVETLQSPEWVKAHDVQLGRVVPLPLELVELGLPADLRATVVANGPCVPIQRGAGRVVLTTVSRLSNCICELAVEGDAGRSETLRATTSHRFYSEDRQEWIPAEQLRAGEQIRGCEGARLRVASVRSVPGVERVYNMTVEGEHVYFVSTLGVLSHNANACGGSNSGAKAPPPSGECPPAGTSGGKPPTQAGGAAASGAKPAAGGAKPAVPAAGNPPKDPAATRPKLRKATKEQAKAAAPKTADGDYIEPNTKGVVPKEGPFDYGHPKGQEWWRTRDRARAEGWTREQVIEAENAKQFQIEDP